MNGPFVIVCDHATNFVPPELHNLGLSSAELARHIAYDIGAAGIARQLSKRFDSPVVFSNVSRLVIDCNRHQNARDLIPEVSDGTTIPGNLNLSEEQKQARIRNYFHPYHDAVEAALSGREAKIFLSVHSMTDQLGSEFRPWPISLSSYKDRTLVEPLLAALREMNDCPVGDNQPYDLDPSFDYTTPYHALRRGMKHLQVEFRQDLVATEEGQREWAGKFEDAIEKAGL